MIAVTEYSEADASEYSAFIPRTAVTAIYATLEFRRFLAAATGARPIYFLARENARIVGVLPLFVANHPRLGRTINSLPWYGSHGGCLLADQERADMRAALLSAATPLWTDNDVAFGTMVLSHSETTHVEEYLARLNPDAIDIRTGQVTELPQNGGELETQLEKVLLQKTRNLARKSLRQGFTLEDGDTDEGWEYLVGTHHENLAALGGRAKPREHFDAIRAYIPAAWRRLMIARLGGRPVAALLLMRFGSTIEYFTPVISHEFRSQQPMSFLIWHGMLQGVRDGFRWWNWGGTWQSQESLFHFKAGWGAQPWPYQYLCRARPDAKAALIADASGVMAAYPYFFLYPING